MTSEMQPQPQPEPKPQSQEQLQLRKREDAIRALKAIHEITRRELEEIQRTTVDDDPPEEILDRIRGQIMPMLGPAGDRCPRCLGSGRA